jgi:hypothetical protein
MIRVVDALDAHCQASGLGRFLAAATETGVVDGTILVSVKFHGSAFVCIRDCCAGGVFCVVADSAEGLKCGGQDAAAELNRMRASMQLEPECVRCRLVALSGTSANWNTDRKAQSCGLWIT